MSATNKTLNFDLPQFVGTDVPSWLVDWNGTMGKIDTALKGATDNANDAKQIASGVEGVAENAVTVATQAQGTASTAQQTATNASALALQNSNKIDEDRVRITALEQGAGGAGEWEPITLTVTEDGSVDYYGVAGSVLLNKKQGILKMNVNINCKQHTATKVANPFAGMPIPNNEQSVFDIRGICFNNVEHQAEPFFFIVREDGKLDLTHSGNRPSGSYPAMIVDQFIFNGEINVKGWGANYYTGV